MYKSLRIIRIIIAVFAMLAPALALVAGWNSVFARMQIMMAIITGAAFWLFVWIIATVIYGRIYCSTVCPLGTLQDCVAAIGRVFKRRGRFRANYHFHKPLGRVRLTVLVIVIACVLCGWTLIPLLLDPYSAFARIVEQFVTAPFFKRGPAVPFAWATFSVAFTSAAVTAIMSFRRGRLLCNTICPVGAFLGFVASRSFFHIDLNPDKCINCGECERVCKAECVNLIHHTVDTSRCVVCFDCTAVCPNDAITYRKGRHRLTMPLMQPTTPMAQMESSTSSEKFSDETVSPTPERHSPTRNG